MANAGAGGVSGLRSCSPGVAVVAAMRTTVVRIQHADVIFDLFLVRAWVVAGPGRSLRLVRGSRRTRSGVDLVEALGTAVL